MQNKRLLTTIVAIVLAVAAVILVINYRKSHTTKPTEVIENTEPDLPINTIPVSERPFITLTPDKTGHSLSISVSGAPQKGSMEYEMVYSASGKQEGALGTIQLASEKQPIVKDILLGSRSAGGATTYHEGVTGGSLTLTYDNTRLKESWNYLHFDPSDPSVSTTDGKLTVNLTKTALKKDEVIVTMKTFGYPKLEGQVVAGPYGYFSQTPIKGTSSVELKLPAGDHTNPTIYEWSGTAWKKLTTKLTGDTVSATVSGNVFVVTAD
jgi:hypothetical protein